MKETPILFSAPMIRAILAGHKTQTRRVMKVQPPDSRYRLSTVISTTGNRKIEGKHHWVVVDGYEVQQESLKYFRSPYGYKDDRLWVRETWKPAGENEYLYYADDFTETLTKNIEKDLTFKWNPSIHMPRKASRITLEILQIRCERLKDISDSDALAEGIEPYSGYIVPKVFEKDSVHIHRFKELWESINGNGSWDLNPYVWAITFKRVE
jgi:hypothetical protein